MSLADHEFSDLLLFPGGWKLKGCPATGQQLVPVPEDCREEVSAIVRELLLRFVKIPNPQLTDEPGELDGAACSRSIRYRHKGIQYRAAAVQDVTGDYTFFLRRLPDAVPGLETLGLPPHLTDWLLKPETLQGLVLVTGAQASGKSTTAASLAAARLTKWGGHGLTLENPAELPLGRAWGEHGYCIQTEIGSEQELARQIECAHRFSSPNVILIGEIRTKRAAMEALRIAQGSSRQVVIATAFGLNLLTAMGTLLKGACELDGESAAHNLANCLLCVIQQELCLTDGGYVLRVPDFLLCPFTEEGDVIRRKIREGKLNALADDIRQQKNRVAYPEWLTRAGD